MPFLFFLFCLFACSSTKVPSPTAAPLATSAADTDQTQNAKIFDDYVHGKIPPEQIQSVKAACAKNASTNIFCASFVRLDDLDRRIRSRNQIVIPPQAKRGRQIPVVGPVFSHGKLRNWRRLKKAKVESLLKGLEHQPPKILEALKKRSLREKGCPNHIAVAVAATLEDSLPSGADLRELASLYEKGGNCARNTPSDHEAYLTRAGLFHYVRKDWKSAAVDFLAASKSAGVYTGRALYWLYRVRKQLNDLVAAKAVSDELYAKFPFSFHSLLVASDGNDDPGSKFLKITPVPVAAKRSRACSAANTFIEQAEVLRQSNYSDSAALIASWALESYPTLETEVKVYLASLGDAHTQVTLIPDLVNEYPSLMSRQTMELLFPKPYLSLFQKNTEGVDPFLLLAIARQESTFDPRAVSPANARGLLQLNPVTALKLTGGSSPDLMDPESNIALGAKLLAKLIKENNGQVYLALAAYNAGQDKVVDWRRQYPTDDAILFIDLISYRETRGYVGSVLRNYFWYRRIAEPNEFALKRIVNSGVERIGERPTVSPTATTKP